MSCEFKYRNFLRKKGLHSNLSNFKFTNRKKPIGEYKAGLPADSLRVTQFYCIWLHLELWNPDTFTWYINKSYNTLYHDFQAYSVTLLTFCFDRFLQVHDLRFVAMLIKYLKWCLIWQNKYWGLLSVQIKSLVSFYGKTQIDLNEYVELK